MNSADITQNPFASSASLDKNPFDDPFADTTPSATVYPGTTVRQADLDQRERDLERRERELQQRSEHIRKHGRNNFPPFFPLIYHDISAEIPEASRPIISRLFQLWLVLGATLIINMVACIFILTSGSSDGGKDLGASIGYIPVIGILSFLLWYRPIYNGFMKEQALYYYLFFFFCGWHLLFSVYMILGIPSTGSAGLIQTISRFSGGSLVAGILGIITTVGWTLQGVGLGFYYRQIWQHHNAQGHTLDKAKGELAVHGAKSYFMRDRAEGSAA
ncbi:scamp family-domain-containing protein [Vararia minispora EC-137]|uniref:Scamp family-domain-containing protein n=1 Tax=Vararia minispora EC-137 TaxID=1314806 RepID=A0ACB8QW47_9AGAM|nr:scamp family-domain-containing protein [Vararia minispora EC-137]